MSTSRLKALLIFLCLLFSSVILTIQICFLHLRYRNRTGQISFRFGRRRIYIRSRPQFMIKRRWRRVRRYKGKMSVRVGRRYQRVKVMLGRTVFRGHSRWKGIRRPKIRRRAVMRVRCGRKLRKVYKRGRRLVMNRKGRLRTVRWGWVGCL